MRILLWGCTYSIWTVHFIADVLVKSGYEIWILKTSNDKKYIKLFETNGVHLIECPKRVTDWYDGNAKGSPLNALYVHWLQIQAAVKKGPYDLINLHYADGFDIVDVTVLKYIMKAKLIVSYWGSDLLRNTRSRLRWLGLFVRHADYVSFENGDLRIKFEQTYKWSHKVNSGTVLFGLPILDIIKEKQDTQAVPLLREKWNVPEHKVIVAVGHNAFLEQQHIAVLESIEQLEPEVKQRVFLLLQMTYGGAKEYIEKVTEVAAKTGCEYLVVERFLTDEEVAELRIMTDIFVHAQIDDAFSGSVCENMFAGTVLINAEWMHYQEFREHDFKYLEFGDTREIGHRIKLVLDQGFDVTGNRELIWQLRSREFCTSKWEKVYREVLGDYEEGIGHRG